MQYCTKDRRENSARMLQSKQRIYNTLLENSFNIREKNINKC